MVQIVHGGAAAFNALVLGEQHPNARNYFQEQLQSIGQTIQAAGAHHYQKAVAMYNQFESSDAVRIAKTALRKVTGLFQTNTIRELVSVEDFQVASPIMQRYVMANPKVRDMFHRQLCDGYSSTYIDFQPGVIGHEHYDYRRVMQGVLVDTDNVEKDWHFRTYLDDLHPEDRELTLMEKSDILTSWERVEALMESGQNDPSDVYGDVL